MSSSEATALIEQQRRLSEHVPTLAEHVSLAHNSAGCRISDFSSTVFQTSGPKAAALRREIVDDCHRAITAATAAGEFNMEQAREAVTEFIVAANNDLFPSEALEVFMGVSLPDLEKLSVLYSSGFDSGRAAQFDDETMGLLVYRAWKILLRVPESRAVLLADGECDPRDVPKETLSSFEAVQTVLARALVADCVCAKFLGWVEALPTSKVAVNSVLSPGEKSFLLSCVRNGHVDWHNSVRPGRATNVTG